MTPWCLIWDDLCSINTVFCYRRDFFAPSALRKRLRSCNFKGMALLLGIRAAQLRAARALVGWSQHDLSRATGVGRRTIADIELGTRDPKTSTLNSLVATLMVAGVRFVDDG